MRPKRVYKTKKNRYYYLRKGKRVYIRRKTGKTKFSQKQVVNISINNVKPKRSRRVKKRKKRKKLSYTKKIIEEQTATKTGLPVYLFEPAKIIPSLSDKVSTKAKKESTTSYADILKQIEEIKGLISLPDEEKPTKNPKTPVEVKPKPPKKKNKYTYKSTLKFLQNKIKKSEIYLEDIDDDSVDMIDALKKETYLQELIFQTLFKDYGISLFDKKKFYKLVRKLVDSEPDTVYGIVVAFYNDIFMKDPDMKIEDEETRKQIQTDDVENPEESGDNNLEGWGFDGEDGLFEDEIEKINSKVFTSTIPVIAKNELDELDKYIKPGMKKFGFIINTDPRPQPKNSNGHWRAVYINNCDDYQSIEYFDPLVSTPEKALVNKLKQITQKINPEEYFLFKINRLQTQPDETDTCGYHSILFLEKRYHNIPWSEATYYNDYIAKTRPEHSTKGEGEVLKAKKKYKTYL